MSLKFKTALISSLLLFGCQNQNTSQLHEESDSTSSTIDSTEEIWSELVSDWDMDPSYKEQIVRYGDLAAAVIYESALMGTKSVFSSKERLIAKQFGNSVKIEKQVNKALEDYSRMMPKATYDWQTSKLNETIINTQQSIERFKKELTLEVSAEGRIEAINNDIATLQKTLDKANSDLGALRRLPAKNIIDVSADSYQDQLGKLKNSVKQAKAQREAWESTKEFQTLAHKAKGTKRAFMKKATSTIIVHGVSILLVVQGAVKIVSDISGTTPQYLPADFVLEKSQAAYDKLINQYYNLPKVNTPASEYEKN